MPIEIISGPPGSGKTTYIINKVRNANAENKKTLLFLPSDAKQIQNSKSISNSRKLSSRAGESCDIDYLESIESTKKILRNLKFDNNTILIFEEAQYYGLEFVKIWLELSESNLFIIISTPTPAQKQKLNTRNVTMVELSTRCCLLSDGIATKFFVLPNTNITLSVCDECAEVILNRARSQIYKMLINNEPHPGEKRVYQPIDLELSDFKELLPIRQDSHVRAEIMKHHIYKTIGNFESRKKSFIDIGCNTGYICKKMADAGFASTGVDVVPGDIYIGKALDAYFYRRYIDFICMDAVEYLLQNDEEYDVTSSFSVFQWLYLQSDQNKVDEALNKLFDITKRIIFFEIGYTAEKHYAGRLKQNINREWANEKLVMSGDFKEIILYKEGDQGLKRDLFVGIK